MSPELSDPSVAYLIEKLESGVRAVYASDPSAELTDIERMGVKAWCQPVAVRMRRLFHEVEDNSEADSTDARAQLETLWVALARAAASLAASCARASSSGGHTHNGRCMQRRDAVAALMVECCDPPCSLSMDSPQLELLASAHMLRLALCEAVRTDDPESAALGVAVRLRKAMHINYGINSCEHWTLKAHALKLEKLVAHGTRALEATLLALLPGPASEVASVPGTGTVRQPGGGGGGNRSAPRPRKHSHPDAAPSVAVVRMLSRDPCVDAARLAAALKTLELSHGDTPLSRDFRAIFNSRAPTRSRVVVSSDAPLPAARFVSACRKACALRPKQPAVPLASMIASQRLAMHAMLNRESAAGTLPLPIESMPPRGLRKRPDLCVCFGPACRSDPYDADAQARIKRCPGCEDAVPFAYAWYCSDACHRAASKANTCPCLAHKQMGAVGV